MVDERVAIALNTHQLVVAATLGDTDVDEAVPVEQRTQRPDVWFAAYRMLLVEFQARFTILS